MTRGEIWWAELDEPQGSAPGYSRPVLVVQADWFNASGISTIIVAVLTTNTAAAKVPGNVLLSPTASGLPKPSVVNLTQLATTDRQSLTRCVGRLPASLMRTVDDGLRVVLDL